MQTYQNGAAEHSNSAKLEVLLLENRFLLQRRSVHLERGRGQVHT